MYLMTKEHLLTGVNGTKVHHLHVHCIPLVPHPTVLALLCLLTQHYKLVSTVHACKCLHHTWHTVRFHVNAVLPEGHAPSTAAAFLLAGAC